MKNKLIKLYIKYNYKGLIIACIIIIFGIISHGVIIPYLIFPAIWFSRSIYHFKERLNKINKLRLRGLSEEDLANIEFAKKWEATRNEGLWKYCIKDGGIIAGVVLAFLCSGIINWMLQKNGAKQPFSDVSTGFAFIGYCYTAGAMLGIILYRILWIINERRFLRLTDPLNTIFTGHKKSYSDLI